MGLTLMLGLVLECRWKTGNPWGASLYRMGPMRLRITTTIRSGLRNQSNIRKIEYMFVSRILGAPNVRRDSKLDPIPPPKSSPPHPTSTPLHSPHPPLVATSRSFIVGLVYHCARAQGVPTIYSMFTVLPRSFDFIAFHWLMKEK